MIFNTIKGLFTNNIDDEIRDNALNENTKAKDRNTARNTSATVTNTASVKDNTEEVIKNTAATNGETVAQNANVESTSKMTTAWKKFGAVLKANTALIGVGAIIGVTLLAAKLSEKALNKNKDKALEVADAYSETKSKVEEINSELEINQQRIDELNAKENLTLLESEELEKLKESNKQLEVQLALKEKLANKEKEEANKTAVQYLNERTGLYNTKTGKFDSSHIEYASQQLEYLDKLQKDIQTKENELAGENVDSQRYKEISQELDALQSSYDIVLGKVQEYNDTFNTIDDNLFEGKDDEWLNQLNTFYHRFHEVITGVAQTNTDAITNILAKEKFAGVKEELIALGKEGSLSCELLNQKFGGQGGLLETLEKAGILTEELLQYIMALANPDAVNYDAVRSQFMSSIGLSDGVNSAADAQIISSLQNAGMFSNKALEAYLVVKEKFGDHPDGWTVEDWIYNIQEELKGADLEVEIKPAITDTIDQMLKQLESQFSALGDVYSSIFSENGFNSNVITNDMLKSLEDAFTNLESDLGIEFDSSELEEFFDVIADGSFTAKEAQDAFNKLATSWFNGTSTLENLNEETAGAIAQQLEQMGVTNANVIVQEQLAKAELQSALAKSDLINSTKDVVDGMLAEAQYANLTKEQIYYLAAAEIAYGNNDLDFSGKIAELQELASAYGNVALEALTASAANRLANGRGTEETIMADIMAQWKRMTSDVELKFNFNTTEAAKSARKAGEDAGKKYLEGLESVISAVGTIIGDKIDDINEQMDAALENLDLQIENLEAQINAIDDEIDRKNDLIDAIQDEIDAIQEANEERQRAIDLQKAEYDLERLQNQNTSLIYSDDKGYHYETDTSEIRDARDAVDDAKTAIQIAEKEKAIKAIEKEIELLEKSKDAINAQIEAIEKQKEATQAYFEQMIKALEEYQNKWDRLSNLKTMAEAEASLQKFGYSVEDVLNMSDEAFEAFANDYVKAIAGANSENDLFLQSLEKLSGIELSGISDDLSKVADSATEVANAISGSGGGGATTSEGGVSTSGSGLAKGLEEVGTASDTHIEQNTIPDFEATKTAVDNVSSSIGSSGGSENLTDKGYPSSTEGSNGSGGGESGTLTGNIVGLGETTDEVIAGEEGVNKKFTDLNVPLGEAKTHMTDMKTTLEDLASQEWIVKVKVDVSGASGLGSFAKANGNVFSSKDYNIAYGNAYAEGTAFVKGGISGATFDHNALVGELGAEMLIRNNRWKLVGLNGTEFIDVKKNDIIFNHKQTEQLLKYGSITGRGKAYANGKVDTLPNGLTPLSIADSEKYKLLSVVSNISDGLNIGTKHLDMLNRNVDTMVKNVSKVNNINNSPTININNPQFTCTGITGEQVLHEIEGQFQGLFLNAYQNTMKR